VGPPSAAKLSFMYAFYIIVCLFGLRGQGAGGNRRGNFNLSCWPTLDHLRDVFIAVGIHELRPNDPNESRLHWGGGLTGRC
jgi:hypothetical protein